MTSAEAITAGATVLGVVLQGGMFMRLGRLLQGFEDHARRLLRLEDWKDQQ